jgi:hypothetical protein
VTALLPHGENRSVASGLGAQKHLYRLNPQTLSQFETWVQQTRQRWEERFEALDKVLERERQKRVKDEPERR